jgi:hypothetical protein
MVALADGRTVVTDEDYAVGLRNRQIRQIFKIGLSMTAAKQNVETATWVWENKRA